jgi:outer membrane protein assembly factor BamB
VGAGWSGFAVSGNAAVTQEQHGEEEHTTSYDLRSGELIWTTRETARFSDPLAGTGPRATPTISDGRVYAVGGTGILKALDLETGRTLWKRDVMSDGGTELPRYGLSSSPLVIDELVVVNAGGADGRSLIAYNAETGEIAWSGGKDPAAYSSPFLTTLAGVRQIVSLNHDSVTGHAPETGRVLWRQEWPDRQSNIVQPLPLPGARLLVSAGWGQGAKLFRLRPEQDGQLVSELLWESIFLKPKFSNPVYHDGFIYGLDDGILVCLDPENGRRRWKRGRYGHGQVLLVGGVLLIQSERGEIVLVEASPEEHRELSRFRVMGGKLWNTPALAGPYLLVRSDQEAALFELPVL